MAEFWDEVDRRYPTQSAALASGKVGLYQTLMWKLGTPEWACEYYRTWLRRYGFWAGPEQQVPQ